MQRNRSVGISLRRLLTSMSVVQGAADRRFLITQLQARRTAFVLDFINANLMVRAVLDQDLRRIVARSDLLVRDGIGAELGCRAYGLPVGDNMNGTDFIPELLQALPRRRVALYGTTEPWLSQAGDRIASFGHDVVDLAHGFHSPGLYLSKARASKPDVVILGMGVLQQERVAAMLRDHAGVDSLIINGGAILDFLAGRVARAPVTVQRLRLEWLYRLAQEPRRLMRRYTVEAGMYLTWVLTDALVLRLRRQTPGNPRPLAVALQIGPSAQWADHNG